MTALGLQNVPVRLAAEEGIETVALVWEDSRAPKSEASGVRHAVQEAGMRLVLDQSYPVGGADHEALATAVMESKAELLIGGNYRNDAIQLTKALDAVGYAPRLVSLSTSAADPAFAEETGELARCVAGYALWLPSIATQGGLASNDVFVQRFRQANGSDPSYLAASSFAAVELLTEAARATTAPSGEIDHGAVRDYLFATSTRTILGPYAVVARGEVASFWERLVQPHVFFLMVQAFPPLHRPIPRRKWHRAVATGQYLLFKRKAYDGIGGHQAVKDAVVEDLRLAQLSTRAGYTVAIRDGGTSLKTRMYQSLGAILEGWSKNMSIGAKQTYGPVRGRLLLAGTLASHPLLWLAPTVVLVAAAAGFVGVPMLACAAIVYVCSAVLWAAVSKQVAGGSALFGVIYPLGAAVVWIIVARSALRGSRITWKERDFKASVPS